MTDQGRSGSRAATGLKYFREAEALARRARQLRAEAVPGQEPDVADHARYLVAEAQVYATLAVAAGLLGVQTDAQAGKAPGDVPRGRTSRGLDQVAAYLDQVSAPDGED